MSEKYDCITFHTPACDEHQDRILNVHGPKGLDDVCPICALKALQEKLEIEENAYDLLAKDNEALQAEVERLKRSMQFLGDVHQENERLRSALQEIYDIPVHGEGHRYEYGGAKMTHYWKPREIAKAALEGE